MEPHYQFSDAAFEKQFKHGLLHPSYFTHEAHLRLAWIHITKYGLENAIENITSQLEAFTKLNNEETKYNKTVTIAAVRGSFSFYIEVQVGQLQRFHR